MPAHCGTLVEEDIWQTSEKLSAPRVWLSRDQAKRFRPASLYHLQRKMHQKENWKTCLSSGPALGLCAHQKLQWELLVFYSDLHRHTQTQVFDSNVRIIYFNKTESLETYIVIIIVSYSDMLPWVHHRGVAIILLSHSHAHLCFISWRIVSPEYGWNDNKSSPDLSMVNFE